MTRLLNMICSAAVMLAVSSSVFAQDAKNNSNMKSNSCDPCNKPKAQCEPCKPCPPCCFFEQGLALTDDVRPPCDVKFHPAYNAAAQPRVDCAWDLNVDVSYIYWNYNQDAMDVAYTAPTLATTSVAGAVVYQDTGYASGFKVGAGWDTLFDNWALNAEYTWFHHSKSGSSTTAATTPYIASDWFAVAPGSTFTGVNSEWKLHMDKLDLVAGRPFYQGTHLTVSPTGGLRGLWIRQNLEVGMTGGSVPTTANTAASTSSSHSWAVGPVAGINTHWIVWEGLRFDGVVGSSLLYTKYTSISNNESRTTALGVTQTTSASTSYSAIRPTMDMGLGLGYGMYTYRNKAYFDLAVRYDFSQFWSQNVMRNFASNLQGYDDAIGDLHLHGLTVTLRADF